MNSTAYVRIGSAYIHYPDILSALAEHIAKGKPGQFAEMDAVRLEHIAKGIRGLNAEEVRGRKAEENPTHPLNERP